MHARDTTDRGFSESRPEALPQDSERRPKVLFKVARTRVTVSLIGHEVETPSKKSKAGRAGVTPRPERNEGVLANWDPGGRLTGLRVLNSKSPVEANKNDAAVIDARNETRKSWPDQDQSEGGTIHEKIATHLGPYHCLPTSPLRSRFIFVLRLIERARHCLGRCEADVPVATRPVWSSRSCHVRPRAS